MVYYFTDTIVKPPAQIYMGKNREENDELVKYGWKSDIWFHVDGLSSAHVYLRLMERYDDARSQLEQLDERLVADCAQLVKENSIDGSKRPFVIVVYTPWSNLHKTSSMEPGVVTFHDETLVKSVKVEGKDQETLKRVVS
jgi:predicted ribosome quality control (RQC) complex YloA/Tae2 family protein